MEYGSQRKVHHVLVFIEADAFRYRIIITLPIIIFESALARCDACSITRWPAILSKNECTVERFLPF